MSKLNDLLDIYAGEIPFARRILYRSGHEPTVPAGPSILSVQFPPQLAARVGYANWQVEPGRLLKLLAKKVEATDPRRSALLVAIAAHLSPEGTPALPPFLNAPRDDSDYDRAYRELLDLLYKLPPDAHSAVRTDLAFQWDIWVAERDGTSYPQNIEILFADDVSSTYGIDVIIVPVGEAMHLIADDEQERDFHLAAMLRDIADSYYLDDELVVEIETSSASLAIGDLRAVDLAAAHRALLKRRDEIPGSIRIEPFDNSSRHALTSEYAFKAFHLGIDEEDDERPRVLLVSDHRAYVAYVLEDDDGTDQELVPSEADRSADYFSEDQILAELEAL